MNQTAPVTQAADSVEGATKVGRGRPATILDAIPAFVEAVRAAEDGFGELWRVEWDRNLAGKALATRAAYTSKYRMAIKEALGDRHASLASITVLDRRDDREYRTTTVDQRSGAGRPSTRRESIEALVRDVAALDHARQTAVASAEKTERQAAAIYKRALAKRWNTELAALRATLKPTSLLAASTYCRNALREANLDDELTLSVVRAPDELQKAVYDTYKASISEQHNELVAIPEWRKLLDVAIAALPSVDKSWTTLESEAQAVADNASRHDLVRYGLALHLLTGRRPYEVFCQGSVLPVPLVAEETAGAHARVRGFDSWRVLFSGQAKTRGKDGTRFDQTFPIPTLTNAKDVIFAWTVIRLSTCGQVWKEMTNEEFWNDLCRVPAQSAIMPGIREELFSSHWPVAVLGDSTNAVEAKRLVPNNIRALYAEIADNFFRPQSQSKAAFFAEILGHTEKDMETAKAYMKYYLPDQKNAGPGKRVKGNLTKKIVAAELARAAH